MSIYKVLGKTWKFYFTILTPIFLSIILATWKSGVTQKEPYGAFVISLMALYWMTECIPIPVTSFIPIILFPLFGILSTGRVTSVYLQDSLLFLLGGCIIALAFEYSKLHLRIALKVMILVGAKISQLLLGIMGTTMALSMWMNNTSTTAMMVPIVNALVEELRVSMLENNRGRTSIISMQDLTISNLRTNHNHSSVIEESIEFAPSELSRGRMKMVETKIKRVRIMFLLGTAFASNIGGTGVITGSATNLIALDLVRKDSDEAHTPNECRSILEISFLDWMLFNVPPMVLNTLLCYFYLQFHFVGLSIKFWQKKSAAQELESRNAKSLEFRIKGTIAEKYESLGPMGLHECAVLGFFFVMVFLWVFKDPQFIPGWDGFFPKTSKGKSIIKEATPTLLITVLMFMFPSKMEYFESFRTGGLGKGIKDPLLSWGFVLEKFPWGIFMLLGGGASMALGAKESGLTKWLDKILASSEFLQTLPNVVLLLLVLILLAGLTTVASNTAVAAIITPVLLGMSYVKGIHPLFLVLPAATVSSYAFILPVSTPPNAIVYNASPHITLTDMMLPGFIINIICILILLLTTLTTSTWFLGFNEYTDQCRNMTTIT